MMDRKSLEQLCQDQKERIKELEDMLYQIMLKQSGGGAAIDEISRIATMDRRQLLDRIKQLETALNETVPAIYQIEQKSDDEIKALSAATDEALIPWGEACVVEVRVWIQHGPNSKTQTEFGQFTPSVMLGNLADVRQKVNGGILDVIRGGVSPADISGDIVGLDAETMLDICRDLLVYRYVEQYKTEYENRRLYWFNRVWPQIEQELKSQSLQYKYKRRDMLKRFKNSIDRSFEKAKNRRADFYEIPVNVLN